MDKLSGQRTNRAKKKKETNQEANPLNTKLSTAHKYIIVIILGVLFFLYDIGQREAKKHECEERLDRSLGLAQLGGGGIVRGLLKAGCDAGNDKHHHRHRSRRRRGLFFILLISF